jgi:hypothetical protein
MHGDRPGPLSFRRGVDGAPAPPEGDHSAVGAWRFRDDHRQCRGRQRGFARVLDLPYNRQELTINLAAAGALNRKLITTTDGYSGDAPIMHQAVAVKASIDALDAGFQESAVPN